MNIARTKEHLRMAFERDDPFTMDGSKCFFNTETYKVHWTGDGLSSVEPAGSEWVLVPGTPHTEWHKVFQEWLHENEIYEVYTTSIGLTLKNLDAGFREAWHEKKIQYAEKKAEEWLRRFN